jgi:hypothetical protein
VAVLALVFHLLKCLRRKKPLGLKRRREAPAQEVYQPMRALKHTITAGVLMAAVGISANLSAQASQPSGTSGSSSTSSPPPSSQGQTTTQSATQSTATSSQGGPDQQAAREHLAAARQALAEITKLPAAAQLQGEQRTQVSNLISAFNAFATATTDWRSKFDIVDQQLTQLLGEESSTASGATTPPSTTGTAGTSGTAGGATGAPGTAGTPAASGAAGAASLDPTIAEKLRTVRKELSEFELASGDPTPHIKAISKILDGANGSAGAAVGTSGSSATATGSSSGSVTLTTAQVEEIKKHLEALRAAANR